MNRFLVGSLPVFFYLLDIGADVNCSGNYYGETYPLHVAISETSLFFKFMKNNSKVIKLAQKILDSLIITGAYVSSRDYLGRTPLHIAAQRNNIYAAQLLLKHNSKVMPRDGEGNTPLDYAESGEMIRLLKDNGAKEF